MKVTVRHAVFEIDDVLAVYSPLLKTMKETSFRTDGEDTEFDFEPEVFAEYVKFLLGEEFKFYIEISIVFNFMGHENVLDLDLPTWKVKLRDNWIRDMFYTLELYREPYFDLVEVPIVNTLDIPIPTGWMVAGGAALWMAGITEKYSDVDLFTCMSKEEANASLSFLNDEWKKGVIPVTMVDRDGKPQLTGSFDPIKKNKHLVSISGNSISWAYSDKYLSTGYPFRSTKIQFILRLYKAPTEIVHGFDLDCVGFLFVPEHMDSKGDLIPSKLYATERALYSAYKKMNWFDPSRASPSYAYRLIKYKGRGFDIYLPHLDETKVDRDAVHRYFAHIDSSFLKQKAQENLEYAIDNNYNWEASEVVDGLFEAIQNAPRNAKGNIELSPEALRRLIVRGLPRGEVDTHDVRTAGKVKDVKIYDEVVTDPASILILASVYNFYPDPFNSPPSDYETKKNSESIDNESNEERLRSQEKPFKIEFDRLAWKSLNPMSQLTGTFCPTPIADLEEWYSTSRFYGEHEEYEYLCGFDVGELHVVDEPNEQGAREHRELLTRVRGYYADYDEVTMMPFERAKELWEKRYRSPQSPSDASVYIDSSGALIVSIGT